MSVRPSVTFRPSNGMRPSVGMRPPIFQGGSTKGQPLVGTAHPQVHIPNVLIGKPLDGNGGFPGSGPAASKFPHGPTIPNKPIVLGKPTIPTGPIVIGKPKLPPGPGIPGPGTKPPVVVIVRPPPTVIVPGEAPVYEAPVYEAPTVPADYPPAPVYDPPPGQVYVPPSGPGYRAPPRQAYNPQQGYRPPVGPGYVPPRGPGRPTAMQPPVPQPTQPPAAPAGTFITVSFQPNVSTEDVNTFLKAYNVAISEGPSPEGLFRVQLSEGELPPDQVKQVVESMQSQTAIIASVQPN